MIRKQKRDPPPLHFAQKKEGGFGGQKLDVDQIRPFFIQEIPEGLGGHGIPLSVNLSQGERAFRLSELPDGDPLAYRNSPGMPSRGGHHPDAETVEIPREGLHIKASPTEPDGPEMAGDLDNLHNRLRKRVKGLLENAVNHARVGAHRSGELANPSVTGQRGRFILGPGFLRAGRMGDGSAFLFHRDFLLLFFR